MDKIVIYLVTFLLFGLPLVVLPLGSSYFEVPKVILAEVIIEALLLMSLIRRGHGIFNKSYLAKYLPVIVILGLSVLGLVIYFTPTSFFGNIFRLQGVFLIWHLLIFSILISSIREFHIPKIIPIMSLALLFLSIFIIGGNEEGRGVGTLGEPNALAAAAVFIFPFVVFSQVRLYSSVGWILTPGIVFLSGSRSGLLAFSLQLVFIILVRVVKLSVTKAVTVCLLLFVLTFVLPFVEGGGWFENRSEIWQTAFISGLNNPLIGSGFGNIEHALKLTSRELNNNVQYQYIDSSHNILLDWWVQTGLIGLGCLIFLVYKLMKNLTIKASTLEITSLLGIVLMLSFNPVSVVNLIAFWWLLGQGLRK